MLLLLFEIGDGRYALTSDQIVEVVPLVKTKKIPMAPNYVAGLMNYRGQPVPVIDLGRFIADAPCEIRFSTRIILVNYQTRASETNQTLGLIAQQVTETVKTDLSQIPASGVLMDKKLYPEEFISDSEKMVQWFDLKKIMPADDIDILFQK